MLHTYLAVPAFPVTSAVPDLSRPSLKLLARWIRDDLEILVAREGPGALRPDDVVTLHEHFVALRRSTTITARDLRATGIHKAVKEVAGIATRWPANLCDECDKIIAVWTDKFGPLDNLPPLLYGRGGRLEGIGSFNESTTEDLLDRWRKVCPDKIDPAVSHRHGNLGFSPGTWWINPLFAHHAGIVGIESINGGTTYDEHCAYALLLNDTGEVDTLDEHSFSYRCSISDRGRFRLTAATVRSRQPIRVLRNHSRTSVWGPKAGTRYEGLYSVKGWIIRQATPKDIMSGGWKEGDIVYEVSLERADTAPLDDVIRRPTNMEMDDYIEYRRLRSVQQEPTCTGPETAQPLPLTRFPVNTPAPPQSLLRSLPRDLHETTFQEVGPDDSGELQDPLPAAIAQTLTQANDLWYQQVIPTPSSGDSTVPIQVHPPSQVSTDKTPSNRGQTPVPSSGSSNRDDLRAIIPWIELEPELLSSSPTSDQGEGKRPMTSQTAGGLGAKAAELNPVKKVRSPARYARKESAASSRNQKQLAASALRLITAKPILGASRKTTDEMDKDKSSKKVAFGKKAKFVDGTGHSADEEDDDHQNPTSKTRRFRSSSMDDMPKLYSPTPIRPTRPHSLFNYGIEDIEFTSPLDSIISRPGMASPVNSLVSSPVMVTRSDKTIGQDVALRRLRRWLSK